MRCLFPVFDISRLHIFFPSTTPTPPQGLLAIGQKLGIQLLAPRSKITVLLIGNHSAGKSTFINWYIEESLQRTGVAMETSSIMLVTSGKKRETLGVSMGEKGGEFYPSIFAVVIYITSISPRAKPRSRPFPSCARWWTRPASSTASRPTSPSRARSASRSSPLSTRRAWSTAR